MKKILLILFSLIVLSGIAAVSLEAAGLLPDFDVKIAKPGLGNLIKEFFFKASNQPDAIGIRVYKNPEHLSPLIWYQENVPRPGSPQALKVDGYEAIREGRTVYVNAANVVNGRIYTNIYLMSYVEDAQPETLEIYNQMLENWEFNTNIDPSEKQALINDVKRWQDLAEIKRLLEKYYAINGHYPRLESGTYIKGHSTSKWPSWQKTLAPLLGQTLPVDPINKFPDCSGYDLETCWNEKTREFKYFDGSNFNYPENTYVYRYTALNNGADYDLDYDGEYGTGCGITECEDGGNCYQAGSCHPSQPKKYCRLGSWLNSCGNKSVQCGEECDTQTETRDCQIDGYKAKETRSCQEDCTWGEWSDCLALEKCGDGKIQEGEECDYLGYKTPIPGDSSPTRQYKCSSTCQFEGGWCGDGTLQTGYGEKCEEPGAGTSEIDQYECVNCDWAGGWCGDKIKNGPEECDDQDGLPSPDPCTTADGYAGEKGKVCQDDCTVKTLDECVTEEYCGDGIVNGPEACEEPGAGTSEQDQYACTDCQWSGGWCGDTIVNGPEACEEPGAGTSEQDQYACTDCQWSGGWCGDGIQQGEYGEECDGTDGLNGWSCPAGQTLSCNACQKACSGGGDPIPPLEAGSQIKFTWDDGYRPLASHLIFGSTHVYYGNLGPENGAEMYKGPPGSGEEWITISALVEGETYKYYIENTDDGYWGLETIKIINTQGVVIREYQAPDFVDYGKYWFLFEIDGTSGKIIEKNIIQGTEP
jgi:hypothetical protein